MQQPFEGLNLNLYPAYLPEILYSGAVLPGIPDLRHLAAPGYEWHQHRIPDADNTAIVASGKWETQISVPVGSYVWAIAGYSAESAGYRVAVRDDGTRTPLFTRTYHAAITGQDETIDGAAYPFAVLDKPRLVIEPGLLTIQIENLDTANANSIQFVLFTAEPRS